MGPPSRAAAFLDSMYGADWTLFAGRPFHFEYQSWILKLVIMVDLPSMLVQAVAGLLLLPIWRFVHIGGYEASYVPAISLFVIGSLRWLFAGHLVQSRLLPRSQ